MGWKASNWDALPHCWSFVSSSCTGWSSTFDRDETSRDCDTGFSRTLRMIGAGPESARFFSESRTSLVGLGNRCVSISIPMFRDSRDRYLVHGTCRLTMCSCRTTLGTRYLLHTLLRSRQICQSGRLEVQDRIK